ncbi:hypothetical protein M9H77_30703 [Catharanthus roseus]|uniref:Uncharacterized protein n=1 Tax=Catharanthus roseus TaxID=4058 RepID=A0ACB9ZYE0_CATRO|nr:hypothetical protein M9H77_30703 [Catharanthus roseus]
MDFSLFSHFEQRRTEESSALPLHARHCDHCSAAAAALRHDGVLTLDAEKELNFSVYAGNAKIEKQIQFVRKVIENENLKLFNVRKYYWQRF